MTETTGKLTKKKGLKPTIVGLTPKEDVIFPRERFSTLRNTLSILKVELPERCFQYEIIESGIRVVCLK